MTNETRTPDLYYAAFLQTAGVPLIRADREGRRVYFVFDNTVANLQELEISWYNNTGKVQAQLFSMNIKTLKALCHSA